MTLSQSHEELGFYLSRQINNLFPDKNEVLPAQLAGSIKIAMERLNYCFSKASNTRYNTGVGTIYNHLYSDHNIVFYWFLANTIWQQTKNDKLAAKFYYLNKALHAFDCMFDTGLPEIFLIFHGAGTMLGKATYSDYFIALQGCTVGMNNGKYPVMGKGVSLTAHSGLIGDCLVGDNVTISGYTCVMDKNIESNTVVFRNEQGANEFKMSKSSYASRIFTKIS